MVRSDLCDYSHMYIVLKGTIDLLAAATKKNDEQTSTLHIKNEHNDRQYRRS